MEDTGVTGNWEAPPMCCFPKLEEHSFRHTLAKARAALQVTTVSRFVSGHYALNKHKSVSAQLRCLRHPWHALPVPRPHPKVKLRHPGTTFITLFNPINMLLFFILIPTPDHSPCVGTCSACLFLTESSVCGTNWYS